MNIPKQAISVLADAERQLRELVASSASAGEYDAIEQIIEWARNVGAMVRAAQQLDGPASGGNTRYNSSYAVSHGDPMGNHSSEAHTNNLETKRRQKSPVREQYPRFFKQRDDLIRIGWSKARKGEYEHKAPRRVMDALTSKIMKRSRSGKLFTAEDLFPLKDLQEGSEVPSYQAYVVLGWLRLCGLIKQHGRRGYSVKHSSRLIEAANTAWQGLPERPI